MRVVSAGNVKIAVAEAENTKIRGRVINTYGIFP
jgi:hypothetical protein